MYSILKTTPSSITLQDEGRTIKVFGESFERGYGSPDFIIDIDSIKIWSSPYEEIPVTANERKSIVQYLLDELTRRKWVVTAE